ncbi:MAG TPA: helix-turn-helix transcriptional regulator [Rhodanobacteraceae bacterium]|nr:helix-turn-helix transcriptional regulator [Rhodanobacteraceae bacterium]
MSTFPSLAAQQERLQPLRLFKKWIYLPWPLYRQQAAMRKSVNRPEYRHVLDCLTQIRHDAMLTQTDLAARLDRTQAFVSSVERGIRRMDLLQVYDWCHACGTDLSSLGAMLDQRLA